MCHFTLKYISDVEDTQAFYGIQQYVSWAFFRVVVGSKFVISQRK